MDHTDLPDDPPPRSSRTAQILIIVTLVMLCGGLAVTTLINRSARLAAETAQAAVAIAKEQVERDLHGSEAARDTMGTALTTAQERCATADHALYLSSIVLAGLAFTYDDHVATTTALASCPTALRDWPWQRLTLMTSLDLQRRHDVEAGTSLMVDGDRVLASGSDGMVQIYDAKLAPLSAVQAHKSATLAVATLTDGRLLTGGADGTMRLWKIGAADPERILVGAAGPVAAVMADGAARGWSLTVAGRVRLWDLTNGTELAGGEAGPGARLLHEHDGVVVRRADGSGLVPDFQVPEAVAAGGAKPAAKTAPAAWTQHEVAAPAAGWIPLTWAASGWICWHPRGDGADLAQVSPTGEVQPIGRLPTPPSAAALTADGTRVAVAAGSVAWVLPLAGGPGLRLPGHDGTITALAFVQDGSHLVTIGDDGTLRLWDATRRRDLEMLPAVDGLAAAAASLDGTRLLVAETGGATEAGSHTTGKVAVIDVKGRKILRRFTTGYPVIAVALSRDGGLGAVAGADGQVRVWPLDGGDASAPLAHPRIAIRAMDFDPQGRRLAVGGADGRVRVFELTDGHEVFACHGHAGAVQAVIFDEGWLFTGGVDGTIRVFTARNGERRLTDDAHREPVTALIRRPNDSSIASAHGRYLVVQAKPGAPPTLNLQLPVTIISLAYDVSGSQLLAVGTDGSVRVIDVISGRTLLQTKDLPAAPRLIAASGRSDVVTVLADGTVAVLPSSR